MLDTPPVVVPSASAGSRGTGRRPNLALVPLRGTLLRLLQGDPGASHGDAEPTEDATEVMSKDTGGC